MIGLASAFAVVVLVPRLAAATSSLATPQQQDTSSARALTAFEQALLSRTQRPRQGVRDSLRVLRVVEGIPQQASTEAIRATLPSLFAALRASTRRNMPEVREALKLLSRHRNAVAALAVHLNSLDVRDHESRRRVLQVLGELQRQDAFDILRTSAWTRLPQREKGSAERITAREYEEVVQSIAVRGIGFIRSEAGQTLPAAENELIRIARTHPSLAVRLVAIDAFLWNHDDSDSATARLRGALPREMHRYITRQRFHRGADPRVFADTSRFEP